MNEIMRIRFPGRQGGDVVAGGITWNKLNGLLSGAAATPRRPRGRSGLLPRNSWECLVTMTSNYITNGIQNRFDPPGQKHDQNVGEHVFPYDALASLAAHEAYRGQKSPL